jgi:hypothetical protein
MAKPTRTAEQLRELVAARVISSQTFQEDLADNPQLSLNLGLPTKHEHDGMSNWTLDFVPHEYIDIASEAIDSVRLEYDMD